MTEKELKRKLKQKGISFPKDGEDFSLPSEWHSLLLELCEKLIKKGWDKKILSARKHLKYFVFTINSHPSPTHRNLWDLIESAQMKAPKLL
jgi:hypothetical protein